MTVYNLHCKKTLRVHSMSYTDYVEIKLETNSKEALDYWNEIFNELLSNDRYLEYLRLDEKNDIDNDEDDGDGEEE